MKLFNILAVLITLSAVFSYLNYRFIKLPTTIGVMVISLLGSLGIAVIGPLGFGLEEDALRLLNSIDFDETLLHVQSECNQNSHLGRPARRHFGGHGILD